MIAEITRSCIVGFLVIPNIDEASSNACSAANDKSAIKKAFLSPAPNNLDPPFSAAFSPISLAAASNVSSPALAAADFPNFLNINARICCTLATIFCIKLDLDAASPNLLTPFCTNVDFPTNSVALVETLDTPFTP